MTDTLMEIIGIFLAILIMFIFPVVAVATKHDEIAQTTVETAVADFVQTVAEKGKITHNDYNNLIHKMNATGNAFDIQIELQLLDDNPERKTVTTSGMADIKGENLYYSVYTENITNKILEKMNKGEEAEYNLKKDDYVIVTVKNTNVTIGTQFKNFLYSIVGKNEYAIGASSAALVTNSGEEEQKDFKGNIVTEEFKERKIKMKILKTETTTISRGGINMVVILDSEQLCSPYHVKRGQMQTSITSVYSSLNSMGPEFYLGFIETAYPSTLKAECSKGNPPNTSEISRTEVNGNYRIAMNRAIQKLEEKSVGNNNINVIVFMAWRPWSTTEIAEANNVLRAKKDKFDMLYTMGCCSKGSFYTGIDSWKATLGTKYGEHLANGMMNGDLTRLLTTTSTKEIEETCDIESTNGKVLLDNLDTSKPIKLIINEREYTYGDNPFNGNVIILSGGKYYLDLRAVASRMGKPNLNDVTVEISFSCR